MATSLAFLSALRACSAAPVPRPPQPIRPIRRVSLPAACAFAFATRFNRAVAAAARAVAVVCFTNVRRLGWGSRIGSSPGEQGKAEIGTDNTVGERRALEPAIDHHCARR